MQKKQNHMENLILHPFWKLFPSRILKQEFRQNNFTQQLLDLVLLLEPHVQNQKISTHRFALKNPLKKHTIKELKKLILGPSQKP